MFSVEDISEITSRNPKFCRIKRATFTCDFCTTSVDVCDERIATALADSKKKKKLLIARFAERKLYAVYMSFNRTKIQTS